MEGNGDDLVCELSLLPSLCVSEWLDVRVNSWCGGAGLVCVSWMGDPSLFICTPMEGCLDSL